MQQNVYKLGDKRPPTLNEVILDPEFIKELREGNVQILKFLDIQRLSDLADYVIEEPTFDDSP